jgi:isoquinoline 1-oxidoreductase beta subunit
MSRRQFLQTGALLAGGLVLACHLPLGGRARAAAGSEPFAPNAFLRIGEDGSVTIIVNKSEMGQGVYTSLPMLVAEELCCDWRKVRVQAAPVAPEYNHATFGPMMVTGGSTSVRTEWGRLSLAGAAAREMLVAAAAAEWKVEPAACRAEKGTVLGPGNRRLSFGQLATKAATLPVPKEPKLKDPKRRTLLGKPLKRLDSPAKINGTALFGMDVREPGMLTAVIARPPVFGARLKSFTPDKAMAVPGVRAVVAVDAGVAVAADGFWPALKGRELLEVSWDEGEWSSLDSGTMATEYARLAQTPGLAARNDGDADAALAKAGRVYRAEYQVPYLAHATMEPLNCFVDLKADRCLIRTGSQMQTGDRAAAARVAGLAPEQVTLETTFLGGGFGRRACPSSDFVVEAVQVAKAVGKPVKVIRTREDDMAAGYYRPMWYNRVAACLDAEGMPLAWRHTIVGQSIMAGTPFEGGIKNGIDETSVEGASDTPYAIPNLRVELHSPANGVPVLWWRSVGHSHTAFVMEGFLDELAHAAGKDPYQYRRALLKKHPRHLKVLETAAKKAGWGKPLPKGRGRGIAVHESFGSFIAQVAEVSLEKGNRVRVHRVVCAVDCGRFVNPDTIAAQMESGITFGLSAALFGAITLKNGRVQQQNFHDYRLVEMKNAPRVEVHIVPSDHDPGGIGEPGVPPIAPAVANALFAASGARVRELPLTPERVQAALKKR